MPRQKGSNARQMSEAEAVGLAMYMEAEGWFALTRRSRSARASVGACNTRREQLERLVDMTSAGRIDTSAPRGDNHSVGYQWILGPEEMRDVLPQITPHLRSKKRQAEIVLHFLSLRRPRGKSWSRGWADLGNPEVRALVEECRLLNQRGKNPDDRDDLEGRPERDRFCSTEGCDKIRYAGQLFCHEHWKQNRQPIQQTCERCGAEFEALLSSKRFCSARCQWQSSYERRENRTIGETRRMLTEAEVREIVARYKSGTENQQQIADAYGADRTTVQKILTGKTWGHLHLDLPESTDKTGARHPGWKDAKHERECRHCGKMFRPLKAEGVYCSRKCAIWERHGKKSE